MTTVRIDKWLWAARFFKTRALAQHACEINRIQSNGHPAKPSRDVRLGDMLQIKNDSGDFNIEVLQLSEVRGAASVAQGFYRETEASKALRATLAAQQKEMPHFEAERIGKPSKRDRRDLSRFKSR